MLPVSRRAAALVPLLLAFAMLVACSGDPDDPQSPAPVAGAATGTAAGGDAGDTSEYDSDTGSSAGGVEATTTTTEGRRETSISGFAFEATITVAAGSEVVWTNLDGAGHTVSAREGVFAAPRWGRVRAFRSPFASPGATSSIARSIPP